MSPIVKAANSDTVMVLARLAMLSMPFVIPFMGWLGLQYLDQRFEEVRTVATQAASRADGAAASAVAAADSANTLNARVDVIEANMASSTQDRADFQKQISRQVEKLTDVVVTTSNQVAGISATLGSMRNESFASAGPPVVH